MKIESYKENQQIISKQVSLLMPSNKKSTRFCVADCFVRLLLLGYHRNLPHASIKFALITPYKFSVATITRLLWRGFVIPKKSIEIHAKLFDIAQFCTKVVEGRPVNCCLSSSSNEDF